MKSIQERYEKIICDFNDWLGCQCQVDQSYGHDLNPWMKDSTKPHPAEDKFKTTSFDDFRELCNFLQYHRHSNYCLKKVIKKVKPLNDNAEE